MSIEINDGMDELGERPCLYCDAPILSLQHICEQCRKTIERGGA